MVHMCQVADFRVKISDSSPDKVTRADEIEHSEYEIRDLWHTTCGLQADDEIKANVLAYMKWTQEFCTSGVMDTWKSHIQRFMDTNFVHYLGG